MRLTPRRVNTTSRIVSRQPMTSTVTLGRTINYNTILGLPVTRSKNLQGAQLTMKEVEAEIIHADGKREKVKSKSLQTSLSKRCKLTYLLLGQDARESTSELQLARSCLFSDSKPSTTNRSCLTRTLSHFKHTTSQSLPEGLRPTRKRAMKVQMHLHLAP